MVTASPSIGSAAPKEMPAAETDASVSLVGRALNVSSAKESDGLALMLMGTSTSPVRPAR